MEGSFKLKATGGRKKPAHHHGGVLVSIRPMPFLAVPDREEIFFVDRKSVRIIGVAWRAFRPQGRAMLTGPAPVLKFDRTGA